MLLLKGTRNDVKVRFPSTTSLRCGQFLVGTHRFSQFELRKGKEERGVVGLGNHSPCCDITAKPAVKSDKQEKLFPLMIFRKMPFIKLFHRVKTPA